MRRTQLYLDEDLWQSLHDHARREKTTISDLVRRAARERYLSNFDERRKAMLAFVGIRKDRRDLPDSTDYVRSLRREKRMERLQKS